MSTVSNLENKSRERVGFGEDEQRNEMDVRCEADAIKWSL